MEYEDSQNNNEYDRQNKEYKKQPEQEVQRLHHHSDSQNKEYHNDVHVPYLPSKSIFKAVLN